MQIDNMLTESLHLLMLGMGTVFFILVLLIVCLSLMASLMAKSADAVDTETSAELNVIKSNTAIPLNVIVAIQAAIHSYRTSPNR
ncbi:MAG: hypothetical protein DRQ44_05770 [Gammaproteobacteria bacterium]|nr:MAG: hypothetical protein DRQ44_05770 [Gammaproteobacteria bacterium]